MLYSKGCFELTNELRNEYPKNRQREMNRFTEFKCLSLNEIGIVRYFPFS